MMIIKATPTKDGNGFFRYRVYTWEHDTNNLYRTFIRIGGNDCVRYESLETLRGNVKSAHLWDGKNWQKAGTWEIVEEIRQ